VTGARVVGHGRRGFGVVPEFVRRVSFASEGRVSIPLPNWASALSFLHPARVSHVYVIGTCIMDLEQSCHPPLSFAPNRHSQEGRAKDAQHTNTRTYAHTHIRIPTHTNYKLVYFRTRVAKLHPPLPATAVNKTSGENNVPSTSAPTPPSPPRRC